MIEPVVKLVQDVESTLPPGFIGSKTGDFLPGWITVVLEVIWSDSILETSVELELSKVSTLLSKLLIFSVRLESWVFWVTGG